MDAAQDGNKMTAASLKPAGTKRHCSSGSLCLCKQVLVFRTVAAHMPHLLIAKKLHWRQRLCQKPHVVLLNHWITKHTLSLQWVLLSNPHALCTTRQDTLHSSLPNVTAGAAAGALANADLGIWHTESQSSSSHQRDWVKKLTQKYWMVNRC
jgi:hypothetical protein